MPESETADQNNSSWSTKISVAIAVLGLFISGGQVYVAKINKESELELSANRADRELNLKLAEFMTRHQDVIFSESEEAIEMQKIMLATFPQNVMYDVFGIFKRTSLESQSSHDFWLEAQLRSTADYSPRVKIYYENEVPRDIIDWIGDTVHGGDIPYDYRDQEIPDGMTRGDIRYFHPQDAQIALRVKKEFEDYCNADGHSVNLKPIALTDSPARSPEGTVEIWLSGEQFMQE